MQLLAVNQSAPSGPGVMSTGLRPVTSGNWLITPDVEIRPMAWASVSVNQSAPSGPAAMSSGVRVGGRGQRM